MPVYQIMGRNGKLYEIEGPPGVTKDQIKAKILARAPEAGLPPQEEGFFSAMGRAAESLVPLSRKGLAAIVEDYPAVVSSVASGLIPGGGAMLRDLGAAASKSETYKELTGDLVAGERKAAGEQLAALGPRKYKGFFEEEGVGRRLGSLAETVALSALPVGAGVATGLITRNPVAAAAVMGAGTVPMTYGGIRERQEVEGIDDVNRAVFGTTASSALDLLTGVGGRVLSGTAATAAKELLEAGLKQAAVRVAKSGVSEMGTETLQNVIEQVAGGTDPTTKQAILETLEAGLAGALGGTAFGGASEIATAPFRKQVAAEAEETSELDIPSTTSVDPEVTLGRLSEAAGPDISPAARIAVEALNRRVSNDLSLSTSESLDASRAFITAREDDIASGKYPEDIAEPYANALAEAKRMLEEVVPATTQAAEDVEKAQGEGLGGSGGGPDLDVAGAVGPSVPDISAAPSAEEVTQTVPQVEPIGVAGAGVPVGETVGAEAGADGALIPEPTLPPQRAELQTPNKWLVKLADRFGMSAPLDAFVKANLGYESLPEALETTGKLELSTSQQAGKVRNLQRNFFDPIVDQTANLKADLGDFGFFLWARGAADRNRVVAESNPQEFPEGGSGLTTAQAAAGLQLLKDEGKLPKLNQLARKVDKLVDFNLEEDIKAGLLSREQANQLREAQPFYVPLKGFAKDGDMLTADIDEDADTMSRQQEAMRSLQTTMPTGSVSEFRTAYGRGSVPFHPLFNLFQDSESRVRRRVVNTALLPTLRAYKQNPTAFEGILNVYSATNPKRVQMGRDIPGGRWEPVPNMEQEYYRNRDKYMMVKENGVPHYIEFAEQGSGADLKRMFANMKPEDLKGAMKVMADINNFMKGMLTYKNPLYLLTVAPLRDTSAAIATALANQNIKTSPAYKKNLAAKTFFQVLNPSTGMTVARYVFGKAPMTDATGQLLQEMIDAGGTPLQSRFMNAQEKAGTAARAIKTMQGIENLSPKERAANLLDGLNRWIDGLADIMDMNARFATYRAATGLGIEPTDAARLALDSSLNLTRRGEMARSLDIALPFFGAGVEASRKTARILTNPKALTKVFGSMIVLGVLESLWNAGQSGDDDEDGQENYLDQDRAGLRMNRLIIYHGSGADDYWKIPIDPMLGYFKFVGNKIGDVMAGTASPSEAATGLVPGFASLMSPLRVPGTDVQSLAVAATPLIGKPFVENSMNQNFFGSPIASEAYPGGAPRSELGRASTGDFWKGLAKVVNEVTDGSEAVSGGADFQPEMYRHIIESYFGGPYQLAKQMVGLKEAEGIADVPGIKSFVGSGSEYAPQSKYFENSATIRQIMGRLSKLTPEQQARQGEKYFEDTDPRVMDAFKAVEANLDRINKEQKASIALAKSDEDKQLVLDYYRKQKNQYYSAFNYTYNATKRGE
jgi:hypothetical protein